MEQARLSMTGMFAVLLFSTWLAGASLAATGSSKPTVSRQWIAVGPQAFIPPSLDAVPADGAGCVVVGYYVLRNGSVAKARVMEGAFTRGAPKEFQQAFADAAVAAVERWTYAPVRRAAVPLPEFQWTVVGYGPQSANGSRVLMGEWEGQDGKVRNACRVDDLAAWGTKHAVSPADVPDHAGKVLFPVDEPAGAFWTHEGLLTPPRYPKPAFESGAEGCVVVGVMVASDGMPSGFRITDTKVSGPGRGREALEQASLQAASQWRFAPGPDNPDRMPAFIQIAMDFAIDDAPARLRCRMEDPPRTPPTTAG